MFLKQQPAEILVVNLDLFHAEGVQLPADCRPGVLFIVELLFCTPLSQFERLHQALRKLVWWHLGFNERIHIQ